MKHYYESGNTKNIANFELLMASVESHGKAYHPVDAKLSLPAMQALYVKVTAANELVNERLSIHRTNQNIRFEAFATLSKLIIQINNMLTLLPVSEKMRTSVKINSKKMQGRRISPRLSSNELDVLKSEGKEVPVQVSAAQTGFDSKINHFEQMIKMLEMIPEYVPNEAHLQKAALQKQLEHLRESNTKVKYSEVNLRHARMVRNELLYSPINGLCTIAQLVKTYLNVVFGKNSAQSKEVRIIKFHKRSFVPINQEFVPINQEVEKKEE